MPKLQSVPATAPSSTVHPFPSAATPWRRRVSIPVTAQALRLLDVGVIYGFGILFFHLYVESTPELATAYQLAVAVAALAAMQVFAVAGAYDERGLTAGRTGMMRIVGWWGATLLLLLAAAALLKVTGDFSRLWFLSWGGAVAAALVASRVALWLLIQNWIAGGLLTVNVALYGAGPQSMTFADRMTRDGEGLYRLVGLFDDRQADRVGDDRRMPGFAELERLVRAEQVQLVVVTLPWSAEPRILEVLAKLRTLPIDIQLAPSSQLPIPLSRTGEIAGIPVLNIFSAPMSGWRRVVKAAEDRILGAIMLLLLAPVMLLVALLVKLDSPGPVLFKQHRYGYNNRLIKVFKFRSMRQDAADANAERLVRPGDNRVTRLGAFLRKSSLDELPQLLNVLRGEMSLVGPRPHALRAKADTRLYEEVVEEYASRHRVKPGITGWAQVKGWRGVTDTEDKIRERVAHDLYYIDNWSVLFDLKILAMTVIAVVKTQNAH
jgi:Undecaprenyl-phosphate glucose phosphotransferase